ncbi:KOW domain-containing RNA-binding protein [Alicyclobacillus acidiphilus]|uniref:KOW domain-containing RNA-binding protein n=1 Tax=Alicyclobacillus acidiphilus TaxID=182455 RepID=UPI00082CC177|nr:KOW domain-containing RNA-binding protein [Alicyclobacillus acidiphilus]
MAVHRELPPLGCLVEVMQGRDAGLIAVVVGQVEGKYLLIADGSVRRSDKPKKKNVAHVRKLSYVATDIAERLQSDGHVTNAQLRYAVRTFLEGRLAAAHDSQQGGA